MWQGAADIAALAVNVVALLTNGELRVLPLDLPRVLPRLGFSSQDGTSEHSTWRCRAGLPEELLTKMLEAAGC
jgi:hypothetical protein